MPSRVLAVLAAGAAVLALAGCGTSATAGSDGRLSVVATTTILSDFARQVGGDRVTVYDVGKPNVDPHDFESSPADLVALATAQVVVRNGIGLEPWFADAITSSDSDARVVDASTGIQLRPGDDPHIWQDPRNAQRMVTTMRDAFIAADPADAAIFRDNAARYLDQLRRLDVDVAREIGELPEENRKVVTNHDAFGYYLARYGLTYVGSIIPSFDSSAELSGKALSGLVAQIRAQHVRAVFSETSLPPRTAEAVASQAGVRVVSGEGSLYGDTLGPPGSPGDTYLHMIQHNTDALVGALR